jgi:hypothetical protein
MDEKKILNRLYNYLSHKSHKFIMPNIFLFFWEADMVSITKAGFLNEFEVKTSRSDFKADSKKTKKHEVLLEGCYTPSYRENLYIERKYPTKWQLTESKRIISGRPNNFYYCCPEDLIKPDEIHDNYGLIYIVQQNGHLFPHEIKRPKKLHKKKCPPELKAKIGESARFRYWSLRLKEES